MPTAHGVSKLRLRGRTSGRGGFLHLRHELIRIRNEKGEKSNSSFSPVLSFNVL